MRRNTERRTGRTVAQVLCMLLLLALLFGILFLQVRRAEGGALREQVRELAYVHTDLAVGYVLRDEMTVKSSNNGPVEYFVPDGGSVRAGALLAHVYSDDTGTDKRESAAELYAEILRLERSLDRTAAWQAGYVSDYDEMMRLLGTGDLHAATVCAAGVGSALEQGSTMEDDGEAVRVRVATLRAQFEELVRYVDAPDALIASEGGRFYWTTDGYEGMFSPDVADTLTPEGLEARLAEDTAKDPLTLGKVVSEGGFYLAVPVEIAKIEGYAVGVSYRVSFSRGGACDMQLTRISQSEDGARALLMLYAGRMPAEMDGCRRQSVTIEKEKIAGLCIPQTSLYTEDGDAYTYVISGGVVSRREVTVLYSDAGVCIVKPVGEGALLHRGEYVAVSARNLYEGKVLYS